MCSELGAKDPRDLSLDTSGTKNFAAFLVEMTQCVPNAVHPVVTSLLPHMQGEVGVVLLCCVIVLYCAVGFVFCLVVLCCVVVQCCTFALYCCNMLCVLWCLCQQCVHLCACCSSSIFEGPPITELLGRAGMYCSKVMVLVSYLTIQSHFMRNGVLGVFGELIIQVLSGPELSDQQRNTREQLLDHLQVSLCCL